MRIKLFGIFRKNAGGAEYQVSGGTIREALEAVFDNNEPLRAAIMDGDALRPHVRVMVNGHDSELAQGLDTAVSEEDELAIFPPIAGG